jgi:hypothetical protein
MVRVRGIEPRSQPWEGRILPLNHTRKKTYTRDFDNVAKNTRESESFYAVNCFVQKNCRARMYRTAVLMSADAAASTTAAVGGTVAL